MNKTISIVIATYNQENFVLETLNSIKDQTSEDYEIIVTDDCSTDKTVENCKNWIRQNNFQKKATVIESPKNTGLSANLNRGIAICSGSFIKPMAGDDLLTKGAVEEFIKAKSGGTYKEIYVSDLDIFPDQIAQIENIRNEYALYFNKCKLPTLIQKKLILKELFIPGPGTLFSKRLFSEIGGYDEMYPFLEEWPFYLKAMDLGCNIVFIDKQLVRYRIHEASLGRVLKEKKRLPNKRVFSDVRRYFYDYRLWRMMKNGMMLDAIKQFIRYELTKFELGKSS